MIDENKYNGWPESSQLKRMWHVKAYDLSWEMIVAISNLKLLNKDDSKMLARLRFDIIQNLKPNHE